MGIFEDIDKFRVLYLVECLIRHDNPPCQQLFKSILAPGFLDAMMKRNKPLEETITYPSFLLLL